MGCKQSVNVPSVVFSTQVCYSVENDVICMDAKTFGAFLAQVRRSLGLTQADGWMSSWVVFPLLAGMEFLMLELWNSFEQSGFYHRFLEACILLDTPFLRLTRVILELLFFFGFGFLVPCAEITIMLFN